MINHRLDKILSENHPESALEPTVIQKDIGNKTTDFHGQDTEWDGNTDGPLRKIISKLARELYSVKLRVADLEREKRKGSDDLKGSDSIWGESRRKKSA